MKATSNIPMFVSVISVLIGYFAIRYNSEDTAPSTAHWGGVPMLMVYLCVCLVTFIAGVVVMRRRARAQLVG